MALNIYSQNDVYMRNAGILKEYNSTYYRLIQMKSLRRSGFEERCANGKGKKGSAGNIKKLDESLSRSRSKVFELSLVNPWEFFVTLTVDGEKHDRYDLDYVYKVIAKWINNSNCARASPIKYLLVPEPHKDKAWHFHGLIMGIPQDELRPFQLSDNIPFIIKRNIKDGRMIYDWLPYSERFGWVTIEAIRNQEFCAAYMTKYITKELQDSSIKLDHHIYYCSKGLARAKTLYIGELRQNIDAPDFANDYVRTKQFCNPIDAMQYFCDKEELYGTNHFDG